MCFDLAVILRNYSKYLLLSSAEQFVVFGPRSYLFEIHKHVFLLLCEKNMRYKIFPFLVIAQPAGRIGGSACTPEKKINRLKTGEAAGHLRERQVRLRRTERTAIEGRWQIAKTGTECLAKIVVSKSKNRLRKTGMGERFLVGRMRYKIT